MKYATPILLLTAALLLWALAASAKMTGVNTLLPPVAPAVNINPLMPLQIAMVVDTNVYPVLPLRTNYTLTFSNPYSCRVDILQSDTFPFVWRNIGSSFSNGYPVVASTKMGFFRLVCPVVTNIMLAWNPSPDRSVVGYNLHYGGSSGIYTNTVDIGNNTNATMTVQPNKTYYIAVAAYNAMGLESQPSNELTYSNSVPRSKDLICELK